MAKGKAKRYSAQEKQEILDFIAAQGRGGQSAAVKKYKVTAATISTWKKKNITPVSTSSPGSNSKERRALDELNQLLSEIETTEKKLAALQKQYQKAKGKL